MYRTMELSFIALARPEVKQRKVYAQRSTINIRVIDKINIHMWRRASKYTVRNIETLQNGKPSCVDNHKEIRYGPVLSSTIHSLYSVLVRFEASAQTSARWPFCTKFSSTISELRWDRVWISKSRKDLMDLTSVAPAFIESRTFLSMWRMRASAFSSWYSIACPYKSERLEIGRTVVSTVSSRIVGLLGRNDVTMVIRSCPPNARSAWWSI